MAGRIVVETDDAEKTEKWKIEVLKRYGYKGGIKKRVEQMIEEDLKSFESTEN